MFGVPRESAAQWVGDSPEEEDFPVWPENWPTVQLFLTLQTQWRIVSGFGGASYLGIDHASLWVTLNGLFPRKERPETFAGVCIMERAALPLLNKRDK